MIFEKFQETFSSQTGSFLDILTSSVDELALRGSCSNTLELLYYGIKYIKQGKRKIHKWKERKERNVVYIEYGLEWQMERWYDL